MGDQGRRVRPHRGMADVPADHGVRRGRDAGSTWGPTVASTRTGASASASSAACSTGPSPGGGRQPPWRPGPCSAAPTSRTLAGRPPATGRSRGGWARHQHAGAGVQDAAQPGDRAQPDRRPGVVDGGGRGRHAQRRGGTPVEQGAVERVDQGHHPHTRRLGAAQGTRQHVVVDRHVGGHPAAVGPHVERHGRHVPRVGRLPRRDAGARRREPATHRGRAVGADLPAGGGQPAHQRQGDVDGAPAVPRHGLDGSAHGRPP